MTEFFKNKKTLITGASGFVGRNLYEAFKNAGLDVIGTSYKNHIDGLIPCDLTSFKEVENIIKNVNYIFMFAAKTYGAGVLKNNPSSMILDTITISANILELAYKYKIEKILYVSSSVVYQDSFKPLAENDLDWNKNPYYMYMGIGWVKRYIEKLCEFYSQLGLKINIVRPTNIYGPYDKYEEGKSHFIPAVIKRIIERQDPLIIWGNGYNIKDLIYVDDFLHDIITIFTNHNGCDAFNICSGQYINIRNIVNILLNICDYKIKPVYDENKPTSVPYKRLIRNKLDTLYGRGQYMPLEEGLKRTVKWLKEELKNEK